MESDQRELETRIRRGEPGAIGEYLQQHRHELLAFIQRRLGADLRSRVEPEDILQELSVIALSRAADLADERRELFGWMCQLAEQRIVDAHRRLFEAQKRTANREVSLGAPAPAARGNSFEELLSASLTTASAAFSRNEKQLRVLQALEQLTEEARTAIRLRYVDGKPTQEIAEQMGKSDMAIRALLSRSIGRLQQVLGVD
jgi:RNA polymerase sigma-70 factor (ECF subfamily)